MAFPVINKIMKINKNNLWIRDLEDFVNELYFQDVISQNDKDYILDLIFKNSKSIASDHVDLSSIRDSIDDARASLDEISTELSILEDEMEASDE